MEVLKMKLLEKLYREEAFSSLSDTREWEKQYHHLMKEITEVESEMFEKFPEMQELFNRFQDIQGKINSITLYHEFETGFKVGAKLMAEILEDEIK